MRFEERLITLPEGNFKTELLFFDEEDKPALKKYFQDWVNLCKDTINIIGGTRTINLPESFSEAIFCCEMNVARCVNPLTGSSSSFDLYDLERKKRIQLKASSSFGPSTFGPRSQYDEVYLLFFREIAEGKEEQNFKKRESGKYEIYKLNPDEFPNLILNKKKNETFEDQQKQGKRPRFTIPEKIIDPNGIKPDKTGDIGLW